MAEASGPTIRELWSQTAAVVGARNEARWLCEVATALDGAEFVGGLDEQATERMVAHLDAMVARHQAGEPLQYVLGRWGFRRLDLAVDRRVLIPRPETELVAEAAIELAAATGPPRLLADLGTGSGAIGLSLAAELPLDGTTVWITDASEDALAVATSNLPGIGRAARNVRVAHGSWFEALPPGERFDVIVSNPPYVAEDSPDLDELVANWEPREALLAGAEGLDAIRELVAGAPEHLVEGGWLVLEIGAHHGSAVRKLFEQAGFEHIEIRSDLAGRDRIAVGQSLTSS
ncbi:MAG TPA: peptide chain release factor N(5)-glutamine methyltransferase [Ilumatobacter sp.]|jgi:release factor glutamine methyltransferase|nr:peptide chain release factor N(5)-glutamine methyltransferase [Ilumatobacter sp.]